MNRALADVLLIFLATFGFSASAQTPLGTSFTYQGQLETAGIPANGLHDMRFELFTLASGGAPIGSSICLDAVSVVDGRLTVPLDFGAQFDGNQRFLQISVRPDSTAGNCTAGTYTQLSPRQPITATPYALKVPGIDGNSLNAADGSPADALIVDNAGNVGIGTTSPLEQLHVVGNEAALRLQDDGDPASFTLLEAFQPGQMRLNNVASTGISLIDINPQPLTPTADAAVRFFRETSTTGLRRVIFNSGNNSNATSAIIGVGGTSSVFQLDGGNFGIGTLAPAYPLHVTGAIAISTTAGDQADALVLGIERSWAFRQQGSGTGTALKLQSVGGGGNKNFLIETTGFVGIGTLTPQAKLDVAGTARVQVLEISGADIAEKFPASEKLEPGMVVAIDAKNSGKLCLARGAYNHCVAGVVSGANNFSVGAVLGNLPGHEDAPAIALSGRVYVQCDASAAAIEPGDLLTTSDTPGYAMKATDRERSHGAVIGKAMEPLAAGKQGLVLVLVNLQ